MPNRKIYVGDRASALVLLKGAIILLCIATSLVVFSATHNSDEPTFAGGFELRATADAGK